jgi:hypothetical protein
MCEQMSAETKFGSTRKTKIGDEMPFNRPIQLLCNLDMPQIEQRGPNLFQ